ncbi:hypothetical protein E1A91_A08G026300v1 [Gossypium mustelinum]|uniref:Uncharacterized protein n=1 Tax=Gossypium mustelinum TaxID=34275 RepID=A0A5D2Y513_GOSMU|nr:hypothetical protein E1A91_A08G026300v1 [Gossypium mustelinum]
MERLPFMYIPEPGHACRTVVQRYKLELSSEYSPNSKQLQLQTESNKSRSNKKPDSRFDLLLHC